VNLGQRFARLATDTVVRRPALWRLFRGPMRRQFDALAPGWKDRQRPDGLASYEAALERVDPPPRRALDLGTGNGRGAFAIARRFAAAEIVGADMSAAMLEQARVETPPELAGRVRWDEADASRLPYADGEFDLVAHANMIPFFDEVARVVAPGGFAVFAFSLGAGTPIWVPPERLRAELARRGFAEFAEIEAANGMALLARKR
jgi:SAM-dependent methyltransferase